ncbi:hypothetical protein GPL17_22075 [Bradyrhizobium yuanmingense]|nr:hypothetical protein [Bradyrhizobium yuanmingense]
MCSLAPFLRGEGWGEGPLSADAIAAGHVPPHPDRTGRCFASPRRSDLSPQAARGKKRALTSINLKPPDACAR